MNGATTMTKDISKTLDAKEQQSFESPLVALWACGMNYAAIRDGKIIGAIREARVLDAFLAANGIDREKVRIVNLEKFMEGKE